MAYHVRKQIRERVEAVLAPVGRVRASRVYAIPQDDLPMILVYTNAEEIERDPFSGYTRTLTLVIELVLQATDNLDDGVDALMASAEAAMGADTTLNGLAIDASLVSIEVSLNAEGEQPIGRARLTYSVLYRTSYLDPTTTV